MEFRLKHPRDKDEAWKAKIRREKGLPEAQKEDRIEVEPYGDLMWAWNGFWRLSNSRPVGFNGVLRIPLSEVEAYARMQRFDYSKTTEFLMFIERMDAVFMAHIDKLREAEELRNKNKEKGRPRRRR